MLARWAEQNVDPSLFPKELMANASNLVGDEEVVFFNSRLAVMFCVISNLSFASNQFSRDATPNKTKVIINLNSMVCGLQMAFSRTCIS